MELLEVKNLTKAYGQTKILNNVSFSVSASEILAVTGVSGSGKTTLLRCLNFLEPFSEGKIFLHNELLYDAAEKYTEKEIRLKRLNFGFVFQSFNLFPQYTALQNVRLAPDYFTKRKKLSKSEKKLELKRNNSDSLEMLERLGLSEKSASYPHELSGGQKQRVAIARALALKPTVLCFDEPTSALDSSLSSEVISVIESLRSPERAILIITHDPKISDRYKNFSIQS